MSICGQRSLSPINDDLERPVPLNESTYYSAMQTVQFTQMRYGTKQDYDLLHELERDYVAELPDRVLAGLRALDDGLSGYQVTRLTHSLQAATRAERDGADIDRSSRR